MPESENGISLRKGRALAGMHLLGYGFFQLKKS